MGASVGAERVARPVSEAGGSEGLEQGGDDGTREEGVDFGGSLMPGLWGLGRSEEQCSITELARVQHPDFLRDGERGLLHSGGHGCVWGTLGTPRQQDGGAEPSLVAPRPSVSALQLSGSCHRHQHLPLPGPNKGKTKIHFPLWEPGEGEPGESHSLLCFGAHTAPYISLELKIHTEF